MKFEKILEKKNIRVQYAEELFDMIFHQIKNLKFKHQALQSHI